MIIKGDIYERKTPMASTTHIAQRKIRTMGRKQITMDYRDTNWGPIPEDWETFPGHGWNLSIAEAEKALAGWTLIYRFGRPCNPDGSPLGESPEAEKWYIGYGFPGCLYDSTEGPFDTREDAEQAAGEALAGYRAEYIDSTVIAEIFSANPEDMGADF